MDSDINLRVNVIMLNTTALKMSRTRKGKNSRNFIISEAVFTRRLCPEHLGIEFEDSELCRKHYIVTARFKTDRLNVETAYGTMSVLTTECITIAYPTILQRTNCNFILFFCSPYLIPVG